VPFYSRIQSRLDAWRSQDGRAGPSTKAQITAERRQQKQKRKINEGKLAEKRHQMDKAKVADAVKRYSYLLGQTDLFRHFVDVQVRPESPLHPNPRLGS